MLFPFLKAKMIPFGLVIMPALFLLFSCEGKKAVETTPDVQPEKSAVSLFLPIHELPDPHPDPDEAWQGLPDGVQVSFVSTDIRFSKGAIPEVVPSNEWQGTGWQGERISGQIALWSGSEAPNVKIAVESLKNENGEELPSDQIRTSFVTYVLADEFGEGCNKRQSSDYDSSLVADVIDHHKKSMTIEKNTVRPVWLSIDIPANQAPGTYRGEVYVINETTSKTLSLEVIVIDRQLPPPAQWAFHLDLWQNPFSVARIYDVPLWSEEHFELLRPHMELLANAGQKCITTGIVDKPWNGQTYDHFQSMIKWTNHKDGSWSYDYSIFDRWVEFAMSCGITEQINGYTMIPWHLKFEYYDEASDRVMALEAEPGSEEYNNHWSGMLKDFVVHLKEKQWLEKMAISMDERAEEAMKNTIALLKEAAPELRVTLAGGMHPDIQSDLFDYCMASAHLYPDDMLASRKAAGKHSTFYTCCVEEYPNTFTYSPPAEASWLGWYAAAKGFDGYLRWAYNSWVKDPLQDSRYTAWPAGDTYLVYPGARTSIRFERLREGIQDFEKIRILRDLWELDPERQDDLKKLEEALAGFNIEALPEKPAAEMINSSKELLN